jgi:uncharacterized membrane protein
MSSKETSEETVESPEDTKSRLELEARDKRRLEAFIDAVVAIAITLLGLEFVVPVLDHSNEALLAFLEEMIPKFLGYFLAFFLIGILLSASWRQFQNIRYADWKLYYINIIFLSFIVLMPVATSILTEYGDTTAGVLFFHCIMLLSSVTLTMNWRYARKHPYILNQNIAPKTLKIISYRNFSLIIASLVAIGIAFISPILSNLSYLLILVSLIYIHFKRH